MFQATAFLWRYRDLSLVGIPCGLLSGVVGQHPAFKVESGSDNPGSAMCKTPKKGRKMFPKRTSSGTVTSFKKLQLSLLNTDLMRKACTGRASSTLLPKKPIELAKYSEYMEMIRKYDVILKTEFQVSSLTNFLSTHPLVVFLLPFAVAQGSPNWSM